MRKYKFKMTFAPQCAAWSVEEKTKIVRHKTSGGD